MAFAQKLYQLYRQISLGRGTVLATRRAGSKKNRQISVRRGNPPRVPLPPEYAACFKQGRWDLFFFIKLPLARGVVRKKRRAHRISSPTRELSERHVSPIIRVPERKLNVFFVRNRKRIYLRRRSINLCII